MSPETSYIFIIDTDSYAGNFERELCAHCTGLTGECSVGLDYAENFHEEMKHLFKSGESEPFSNIEYQQEGGCSRPVDSCVSPGGGHNSIMMIFEDMPTVEQLEIIKERASTFREASIKLNDEFAVVFGVIGYRLIKKSVTFEQIPLPEK